MKLHNLLVDKAKLKAKRTVTTKKPRATAINEWWGIDMTKVQTVGGWVYIVLVLDWFSKKIVGYEIDDRSKTRHWLNALDMAVNSNFPYGVREQNLNLMSDNGSQPTSILFMATTKNLGINQAFTSYNNPKGNADTERIIRTMKEEILWLNEWQNLSELKLSLTNWIDWYNEEYLHSSLDYKTPNSVHNNFILSKENFLQKVA